uniref:Uncharacterized protein n=1 Tax=Chelonoidis abingdonii TaxID=106734 RepID=A0A8C0H7G4_CHEAB
IDRSRSPSQLPAAPPACTPIATDPAPLTPPRRFVLLSLFSTFFCNVCCLGFVALVFSFKARDRNVLGDTDGAGSNVKTVKCLNIAVLVLGCSVVLLSDITILNTLTCACANRSYALLRRYMDSLFF